jgi:hypothetical protein
MLRLRFVDENRFQGAALRLLGASLGAAGLAALIADAWGRPALPAAPVAAGLTTLLFAVHAFSAAKGFLRVQVAAGFALAGLAACFALERLSSLCQDWPGLLQAAAAGVSVAATGALGLASSHLRFSCDRVGPRWRRLAPVLADEMRALCERAVGLCNDLDRLGVAGPCPAEPCNLRPIRRTLENSALRLLDVASHWTITHADRKLPSADELGSRLAEIEARITRAVDPQAREQYRQVRFTLQEQLQCLRAIDATRERVVARMHHTLAAMERLRFAAINQLSTDASRASTEVQPLIENLARLGQDLDIASEAMREVE